MADREKIKTLTKSVLEYRRGFTVALMIHLGDRLGLYVALRGAGPVTADELAARTGLHPRWLVEWLRGQAGAGLIEYRGDDRFELSEEAGLILADEANLASAIGMFAAVPSLTARLDKLPESFRSGRGYSFDDAGTEGAIATGRSRAPWFRAGLVSVLLPALDGVVAKLERGAVVADVGCGVGVAAREMAERYPASEFHGYETSGHALQLARQAASEAGLLNLSFHDVAGEPLPGDGRFDLITTFDVIHDLPQPLEMLTGLRRAIKDDGTWLCEDIKAPPSFDEGLADSPNLVSALYSMSVLGCLPSGLSEPDGMGLGTLGLTEAVARDFTSRCGFTRFTVHDFRRPPHIHYEMRP